MERARRLRPRGEFSRSVLTLAAGTGVAQVIVIASSPVLTRLYAPADYGVFSVATSLMAILMTVTCLRYEFAIPLPDEDETAANIVALALLVNLAMSVGGFLVLWLAGGWFIAFFNVAVLGPSILLVTLGQLGGGTASSLTNWAVRTKTFSAIAATQFTQAIALVTVQVGLGLAGLGPSGLLLGDVAGRVTGSSRLARSAWRTHAAAFRRVSLTGIATAARRYRRFPIFSSPSALLNALGLQLPLLTMVAFYGAQAGGHFALADRVCSIPLVLIAGAVGQVYMAEAARNAQDQPQAIRGLFLRTTLTLARTAAGPAILLAILAPLFAGFIFGAAWSEMGLFVAVLAPMYFVAFVTTATGNTLYVLERLDLQLVREALRVGLLGGAVPLAAALGLDQVAAVALLSAAGCLSYLLYGLISWRAIGAAPSRHPVVAASPAAEEVIVELAGGDDPRGLR